MSELKITRVIVKVDDVKYIDMENGGGNYVTVPKGFDGHVSIELSDNCSLNISVNGLKKILVDGATKEDLQDYHNLKKVLDIFKYDEDCIKELEHDLGKLENYEDITDQEFNCFAKIGKQTLISSGLWIGNGIRKIELYFDDIFQELLSSLVDMKEGKNKIIAEVVFTSKNNDKLSTPISFKVTREGKSFFAWIDTDLLAHSFMESDTSHSFYGNIHINIIYKDSNIPKNSLVFDFSLMMTNPAHSNIHAKTEEIAIDFGTSSTCIAYDKGKKLISFNDNPESIEDYENMTALIIYNWKKLYNVWNKDNTIVPHMIRSKNGADKVDVKNDHFDYGDRIKEELKEAPSSRTMDAVILKLKSLPGNFEDNKEYLENIIPFDDWKKKVFLTDKIEDENEETLNPIALYGYLIGRSLNKQTSNKIYTRYNLTMPVNFSTYKREKILKSLEYGLKRSLPSSLQTSLQLKNDYEESVALLGAAKKLKHLKIDNPKSATLFAVFDFGGGTLDFAFGLYRKASESKEISVFENENNQFNNIIEIFNTDGELVGGETLIESLSWEIYKNNKDAMKEHNIPIFVPNGEDKLQNFPDNLMGNRHIDHVNLKSFNETFSRDFFVNNKFTKTKIELIDRDGNKQEIEVEDLKEESTDEFLKEKILKLVENFKTSLESNFNDKIERVKLFGFDNFSLGDVKIIQAGNACKAKWIQDSFDEVFTEHKNIIFLNNEKKKITPKNAVAKGALMLDGIGVFNHSIVQGKDNLMPLDRYIWDLNAVGEENEDAEPTFKRGANTKDDVASIGKRKDNTFTVYFSFVSSLEDEDDDNFKNRIITIPKECMEEDKFDIWAKPYDGSKIECCMANKKGENMDETKKFIINLNTGEVTK